MSQTKAQLVSGTTAQDLTVDNINTTSVNSGALSNRNMIINGNFFVNQRNADSAVTINNNGTDYPCDRWSSNSDNMGQFSLQRKTDGTQGTTGNKNYLRATMLSALASPTSQVIEQPIEGFTSSRCQLGTNNPKTITLSFWVRSSITGTFGGSLTSSNEGLSQTFSYTYSVADTWQHVTYTFSATGGTTGSFSTDNSKGLCLNFSLGNSAGRQAATGSWVSGVKFGPTGETNICATNGATWDVTQVQLEVGSTATDFEFRSVAEELALCHRYYQQFPESTGDGYGLIFNGYVPNSTTVQGAFIFPEMRSSPTITNSGNFRILHQSSAVTVSSFNYFHSQKTSLNPQAITSSTLTVGQGAMVGANNDTTARIKLSAEL
tara:strand:- start:86 stop:1216 length:1131 start_codon:yes stop_codon:yes gene_type:complete